MSVDGRWDLNRRLKG